MDDIILRGDDNKELEKIKRSLAKELEVKDLGKLQYFLGIEMARTRRRISISQQKYVLNLLKDTRMLGSKPVTTPIDINHKLKVLCQQ